MSDLTEFLLARIDEETTMAEFQRDWAARRYPEYKGIPDMEMDPDSVGRVQVGPARILAECDAKRAIVELHTPVPVDLTGNCCMTCLSSLPGPTRVGTRTIRSDGRYEPY